MALALSGVWFSGEYENQVDQKLELAQDKIG